MLFLITEKNSLNLIKMNALTSSCSFEEIDSKGIKEDFCLLLINGNPNLITEILIKNKISGRYLLPLVSDDLFIELFGRRYFDESKMTPILMTSSTLENIIAPERGLKAKKNVVFYDISSLSSNENYSLKKVAEENIKLKQHGLILDVKFIEVTLKDILAKSISNTIKKEIKFDEFIYISEIEKRNDEFFLSVIAEFILTANKYYSKKEIKEFLIREFDLLEE